MLTALLVILSGLVYLMLETNWMTIRLPMGADTMSPYWLLLRLGDFYATEDDIRDMRHQLMWPGKGVKGIDWHNTTYTPLVSWDWLKVHWHDLDGYQQDIEIDAYGVRSKMTVKQPAVIKEVMKALKPSRAMKLQYAD